MKKTVKKWLLKIYYDHRFGELKDLDLYILKLFKDTITVTNCQPIRRLHFSWKTLFKVNLGSNGRYNSKSK